MYPFRFQGIYQVQRPNKGISQDQIIGQDQGPDEGIDQDQRIHWNQELNQDLQLHPDQVHELDHHKLAEDQRQDLY